MSETTPGVWWHVTDEKLAEGIGGIVGALSAVPDGPTPLQWKMLEAVVKHVFSSDLDPRTVPVLDPEQLASVLLTGRARLLVIHLMVTLEFVRHPEPVAVADSVARYAKALDVDEPMVSAARDFADDQALLLYLDIQRNAEFTEQTVRGVLQGRWWRLLRNKIAYQGFVSDPAIAARWRALDACPDGSWGRAVADFYHRHGFTYPGEKDGISEVGARHDFVHVLADYPPTPEGEIDVFALIAAAMPDPHGFTQFAMTLGLFQNGAIRHVAGKRIRIARTDTLSDPGAPARWADAMRRGAACTADVLNVDHFAMKDLPLEEARERLGLLPKGVSGPDEPKRRKARTAAQRTVASGEVPPKQASTGNAAGPKQASIRMKVRLRWPTSST